MYQNINKFITFILKPYEQTHQNSKYKINLNWLQDQFTIYYNIMLYYTKKQHSCLTILKKHMFGNTVFNIIHQWYIYIYIYIYTRLLIL